MKHSMLSFALRALAAAVVSGASLAGGLNPPGGPIGPTMKTLDEIEPRRPIDWLNTPGDADSNFKIIQSGSYYLTGPIIGGSGKSGIKIAASNVTIDLSGFEVRGTLGSLHGITVEGVQSHITIRNGTVRNWRSSGISLGSVLGGSNAFGHTIERVLVENNTGRGIIAGRNTMIDACVARDNGSIGIEVGDGSVVRATRSFDNGGNGIETGSGSSVQNSAASRNTGFGIRLGNGCSVSNSSANNNTSSGFWSGVATVFDSCSAFGNGAAGFTASAGSVFQSCAARNNSSDGFNASESIYTACSSQENGGDGFRIGSGSSVAGSTATNNAGHGVWANSNNRIADNHIRGNGPDQSTNASIRVEGSGNDIDGNSVANNHYGVRVTGAGNLIRRNVARLCNFNFVFASNNRFGAISAMTGETGFYSSGNSVNGNIGSTDPWANLSFR